jgi:long-chain fatty acid transport protein
MHRKFRGAAACALALWAASTLTRPGVASASGFALPELSAAGVGTANALVANPEALGAVPYNPAAMGFHEGSSLALGAIFIGPSFTVRNAAGRSDSQGADWYAGPLLQGALRLSDRWRLGLGVNAPFGLETRWTYGTFPALSRSVTVPTPRGPLTIPTGNHPTASNLEVVDFVPSAAYRVSEALSLGLGLDLYWAKSAELSSNLGSLRGDGDGIGFNLSALYRRGALSLGAAFRSGATLDIEGSYAPQSRPLVAAGRLPPAQGARVDLDLPWSLQLGVRYAFNDALALELDWTRTGWSVFDRLEVKGSETGTPIFTDVNDWEDSNAYRLGLTYQIRPQTQVRLGYSYDQSGQQDDHFSARVPDSDRQLFGIGVAQSLGQGLSLEAGYMYVHMDPRSLRSATPYRPGGEVNGTAALNGTYEMDAHVIGIELVKAF